MSDSHVLGQKVLRGKTEGMLQILVFVENREEASYETMLNITLPPGVSFFRITERKYVSYFVGFVNQCTLEDKSHHVKNIPI